MNQKKSGIFYGWIILAVSFITMMMGYGMRYSFPVFFVAMLENFGWSRASTALAFSLHLAVYGLSSPLVGHLLDRFGPRKLLPMGAIILALGMAASSLISARWHFYLLYGVVAGFGVNCLGRVPHSTILARWFVRRRGTAIGIALAGAGVAMLVLTPLAQYLISTISWQAAYIVAGALVLLVVPLSAIFQRRQPEDMGLSPDGLSQAEAEVGGGRGRRIVYVVDERWAATDWTLKKAARTYRYPLLFLNCLGMGLGLNLILAHQMAHYVDVGYDKMFAAAVVGTLGIPMLVGRVLGGSLSDRWGREVTYTLGALLYVAGIAALMLVADASQPWMLWTVVICFGLGYGMDSPVNAAITADVFQGKGFGLILGSLTLAYGSGGFLGPWLGGYIFDITGDYTAAFGVAMAAVGLAAILVWAIAPRKVRLVHGRAVRAAQTGPGYG